jgi:hypothetical protein
MLAFPKNRGLRIDTILAGKALGKKAVMPESIAKCEKGKNLPITGRFGQSSSCRNRRFNQ